MGRKLNLPFAPDSSSKGFLGLRQLTSGSWVQIKDTVDFEEELVTISNQPSIFDEPVISLRHTGRRIRHGLHGPVACDTRQILPIQGGKGINVLRSVSFPRFGLEGENETVADFGGRENSGRRPNPKTALNGETGAARHSGEGLADGAAQLKAAAGAECRAAAGNDTASDGKSGTALGESRS